MVEAVKLVCSRAVLAPGVLERLQREAFDDVLVELHWPWQADNLSFMTRECLLFLGRKPCLALARQRV